MPGCRKLPCLWAVARNTHAETGVCVIICVYLRVDVWVYAVFCLLFLCFACLLSFSLSFFLSFLPGYNTKPPFASLDRCFSIWIT